MSLEQKIQKSILDYINNTKGCVAWKIMKANERGVPDILACLFGIFTGIEVKKPGEEATEIQQAQMQRIRDAGGTAWCISSVDEAVKIVKYASALFK